MDYDDSVYDMLNGVESMTHHHDSGHHTQLGSGSNGYSYDSSSSPSDSSSAESTSNENAWAYELGLTSIPSGLVALPHSTTTTSSWTTATHHSQAAQQEWIQTRDDNDSRSQSDSITTMTNEFWNPTTTDDTSQTVSKNSVSMVNDYYSSAAATGVKSDTAGMDVDFEDVLNQTQGG